MKMLWIFMLVISFLVLTQCTHPKTETIVIAGSDTMVNLATSWAEEYMKTHPNIKIQVSGGGSGFGIAQIINASVNIANCSRDLSEKEKQRIKSARGEEPNIIPVAIDCLTIYVNEDNKLDEISIPTIKKIFTGEITNWRQIGWDDAKITVYSRENSSGTYIYFKNDVLKDESFGKDTQYLPGTAAIVNAVAEDKYAIGYGGVGYIAKGVKPLKIKKDDNSTAYEPNEQNAISGDYPLKRDLYIIVVGQPKGAIKDYIDWIKSPEGQKICKNMGFFARYRQ